MMNVKVLGTGCANCKNTLKLIQLSSASIKFPRSSTSQPDSSVRSMFSNRRHSPS